MNKKAQLIERIKAQLKSIMEVKLAQHKAGDLIITTEEDIIAIDSQVYYQDEAGNNIPIEDGDYTLDSGEIISVLNGKVVSIKKQEVTDEVIDEVVMQDDVIEDVVEDVIEDVVVDDSSVEDVSEADVFRKKLKDLEDKVEMLMKKIEDSQMEMKNKLSEIAEQPSASSITVKPVELSSGNTVVDFDFKAMREKIRKNQK